MKKIILIGDFIDKGVNPKDTIEFVYKNWKSGKILMVLGNHENYVYKALKGTLLERNIDLSSVDGELLTKITIDPRFKNLLSIYNNLDDQEDFKTLLKDSEGVNKNKLMDIIKKVRIDHLENNYFTSISLLESNEDLKSKFFELVEASRDFLSHRDFIVTHAPCKNEYLGKVTGNALKHQRNTIYPKRIDFESNELYTEAVEKHFQYLKDDARHNHPKHVMGHVAIRNVVNIFNKIMIDTGCATGGQLSSITFNQHGKPFIAHVKSKTEDNGEIISIFERKIKTIDLDTIEPEYKTRIKYLIKDKINFISGTMSPSDKEDTTLESLKQGIEYYRNMGVKKLILQPKFMGSRGNLYLHKEIEKTYLVSRNGYKVKSKFVPTEDIIAMAKPIHESLFDVLEKQYDKQIKIVLLDCEVLPWSLMGKNLIDQHFTPVSVGITTELNSLKELGFEERLAQLKSHPDYVEYLTLSSGGRTSSSKDELTEKYGYTKERTFRNFNTYEHISIEDELIYVENYTKQVNNYGDTEIKKEFKPFSILKIIFEDDSEKTFEDESNIEIFDIIASAHTPYAVLDFETHDFNIKQFPEEMAYLGEDYIVQVYTPEFKNKGKIGGNTAFGFYSYLTKTQKMEGIVLKPEKVYTKGIAPYLKVRNEDYLTIVYGHNYKFKTKYDKLIAKKSVRRKISTSINEFKLGMDMLKIPYSALDDNNIECKQLMAQMIVEVENEKTLDPRL